MARLRVRALADIGPLEKCTNLIFLSAIHVVRHYSISGANYGPLQ
jgi:hypothetical protein